MKRISILLSFIACCLFASSFGTWTVYHTDKGLCKYGVINWDYTDTIINKLLYHATYIDNLKIRFDENKVYQYLCDTQEEVLVIDMGLKVGDTFKMRNGEELVVTAVKDTTINLYEATETRKCIHLKGKKNDGYTDVWIDGIGSLKYGFFPENDGKSQRLLSFEDCVFTFNENNMQSLLITPGERNEDITQEKVTINLLLQDGVLHIDGYAYYDGCGLWYLFVVEKDGVIEISYLETPLDCDGRCLRKFSAKIDGFEASLYDVYFGSYGKEYFGTIENGSTQGVNKKTVDEYTITSTLEAGILTIHFPTVQADEAITLYDATGRAVATQAVRQGATTATIDVATLPAGVYIARLNSGATAKVVL